MGSSLIDIIKQLQAALNAGGASPQLKVDGVAGVRTIAELERQEKATKAAAPAPTTQPTTPGHFPAKCRTRAAAIAHFGAIDLEHAHWPDQSKWMDYLAIPEGFFPGITKIYCNKDIHGPLLAALTEVHTKGLSPVLKTFDGCFNIRAVRGSSNMSTHAYGLAVDINASINPLASTHGDFTKHLDVVDCFKSQGFDWGGDWNGRKDSMHFSYAWE